MKLRANHWREWYWQYFAIIEILSEATWYKLDIDSILVISNLYNFDKLLISYLFELELLVKDDKHFRSPSLLKRMALKDDKKIKQSIGGVKAMEKRRWEQESYKLLITSKVKESKVKERKVKESKVKERKEEKSINIPFTSFRDLYNRKVWDKNACEKKWEKLKPEEREKIINTLPDRLHQFSDKQFQPHPETYLNQKRWNDEIKSFNPNKITLLHNKPLKDVQ